MYKLKSIYLPFSLLLLINSNCYGKDVSVTIESIPAIKHDISMPLRDINKFTLHNKNKTDQSFSSDLQQKYRVKASIPLHAFPGMGVGFGNYQVKSTVSNANGAAGLTQYIQLVNYDISIFDKITGKPLSGFPKPSNTIWTGFGGLCESLNDGNPIVKFDQLAQRWVLTQKVFADWVNGPFFQCVAISTTEDATGSYYRYAFSFDSINDQGKLALWPDAYYMSFVMNGPSAYGTRICALDRSKMLAGQSATMQCRQFDELKYPDPLLPVDLDGTLLPYPNSPGYFLGLGSYRSLSILQLYQFFVDFNNVKNSKLVGPFIFSTPYSQSPNGAIQPQTNNQLDTHTESLMHRASYRQFTDHGSLVANHTDSSSYYSPANIRWYELRFTNNSTIPTIYQQVTNTPDSKYRYNGSIAMDKLGNIAVGYSVSSSAVFPSIELAARNAQDPLNTMSILQPLRTGHGYQPSISDWGTYSSMSIDPVDDCTFWYTNQYLASTGVSNWSTYIFSFKLAGC